MLSTATLSRQPDRTVDLSEDDIFDVLSNRRRRFVIHALKREDRPLEVAELSTYVTAWEHGMDPDHVKYEDRRNVHSTLTRTHLPKLEENDVIIYDTEASVVEPTPTLNDLDIYIEVLQGREIPWSQYYVGLAGIAVALLIAIQTGVPGLAAFEPLAVSVFTVTAFAVSATIHYHYGERARLGADAKPPEVRTRE